jgi:CBS domain containing-hemolysin-like protein
MIALLLILGVLFGLVLSGLVSGLETGIYSLNRVRLRVRADGRERRAGRLQAVMARTEDAFITLLLGNTVADYVSTICLTSLLLLAATSPAWTEVYTTLILTPLVLVFGGIIPKDWFRRDCERLMYLFATPLHVGVALTRVTGLVYVLRALTARLNRWLGQSGGSNNPSEVLPRTHMLQMLEEGAVSGGLSRMQRDLMERVVNVTHVRVASVMIPRARAATVPLDIPREEFLRIARMAHFSRLPVWRGDPRRMVGFVAVFDILTDEKKQPIAAHLREAVTLAPDDRVPAALQKMQQARKPMAIVEDRQSQCLGILTIKDLVEEIVGDLEAW